MFEINIWVYSLMVIYIAFTLLLISWGIQQTNRKIGEFSLTKMEALNRTEEFLHKISNEEAENIVISYRIDNPNTTTKVNSTYSVWKNE